MKTRLRSALAVGAATALLVACATSSSHPASRGEAPAAAAGAAPKKIYSAEERKWLTACVGMTDTAWAVASDKKNGVAKEAARARYAGLPRPELAYATVEKVYKDDVQHPWDYSVRFFRNCASELAHVPGERTNLAAYCMQNVMISSVAFAQKRSGATKEQVYRQFEQLKSDTPRTIVDRVYAGSGDRGATLMGEWDSCVGPLAE